MRVRLHRASAVLLMVAAVGLTGCGSNGAKTASTTTLPPTPCGRSSTLRMGRPPSVELTAAAVLGFTIKVDATRSAHARCVIPSGDSGEVIRLSLGDRIEYEANWSPNHHSGATALSRIVSISSKPLPRSTGPLPTPHVLVTLTAVAPGTATVAYTNCSGTGC